jgi:hypothetical protein
LTPKIILIQVSCQKPVSDTQRYVDGNLRCFNLGKNLGSSHRTVAHFSSGVCANTCAAVQGSVGIAPQRDGGVTDLEPGVPAYTKLDNGHSAVMIISTRCLALKKRLAQGDSAYTRAVMSPLTITSALKGLSISGSSSAPGVSSMPSPGMRPDSTSLSGLGYRCA